MYYDSVSTNRQTMVGGFIAQTDRQNHCLTNCFIWLNQSVKTFSRFNLPSRVSHDFLTVGHFLVISNDIPRPTPALEWSSVFLARAEGIVHCSSGVDFT